MWRVIYSVSPRTPEGGQAGKGDKPSSYHILRSRSTHIQQSLATSERGKVGTEKGRNDEGRLTKVM
ncbi:phosphinothricin acetyltransferase [Capnocytophaga ochracea]|uniref:phosphinothricin acetyltransferase n=1 Tax=Capnocytophaga ochracea TaxID=1018 RepID=UPI0009D67B2F|nr:phosphinothricin acetyltransferase [Capnocytophaga ochracea]UEB44303.1 phosphinothricin acetyltransferase [Capnocytophaga ochracea]